VTQRPTNTPLGPTCNFSIKETDGPTVVHSYNDYELDVTIENIGHLQGSMPVDVVIERNVSSGWSHVDTKRFPRTIDGLLTRRTKTT